MCKLEYLYSKNWSVVNRPAAEIVSINPLRNPDRLPWSKLAWPAVKYTPEASKRIVFIAARRQGVKGVIPLGGQTAPIQIEGEVL
jgi:hypothetical protein